VNHGYDFVGTGGEEDVEDLGILELERFVGLLVVSSDLNEFGVSYHVDFQR
jgi:hypothetical protein